MKLPTRTDILYCILLSLPFVVLIAMVGAMKLHEPTVIAQIDAETRYIAANRCVVTQLHGGEATQYRCDTPKERYISGKQLSQESQSYAVTHTTK